MRLRSIALMLSSIVIVGTLVGCTGNKSEVNNGSNVNETADVQDKYTPFTIDNYGRELTITQRPTKVLTLGPNTTELFIALGLSQYIIGNSLDNHSRGALPAYEEQYAEIPELTYGPATREAVLTSGADFVYGIDWEFGEEAVDISELEEYGMTTYVNSATTLDQMYQEIRDIGKIFEIEDAAEAFIKDQEARMLQVNEVVADQEPVKVLVYDSGGNGVFTATGTNFETLLIELAGGKNIFDDITDKQWSTVSYEEILARQPDVILIHDYDVPALEQKLLEIHSDPVLSQLDAVKEKRFVTISLESVLPGDRMAYTVETLAKGFYPELFE
ncbi:ABC transporter substrate-binding protein [Paenibacillus endoradicis]|uniref:ABC transporter substrate-binding protein n=1 Tax=Paenibacillus endoradicis TaxID=2972487 RepID=UPI00215969BB|nr:ABC transporter substrate-binding protein [Paenibacillus endoradicis]MCR8656808.1 ABC transporter substrate-binding protein [Paenibacillus endoradicis]